jgi:hypothetical protein
MWRRSFALSGLILTLTFLPAGSSESSGQFSRLCDRLSALIVQYFPEAVVEREALSFKARYKTRAFMIHHPLKTGEWQDARPQEGPDRGGFICSIESADGPWAGAAVVPQTFDHCYFSSILMAPYHKRLNKHLTAHLDFPVGTPGKFIEDYGKLVQSFGTEFGDGASN